MSHSIDKKMRSYRLLISPILDIFLAILSSIRSIISSITLSKYSKVLIARTHTSSCLRSCEIIGIVISFILSYSLVIDWDSVEMRIVFLSECQLENLFLSRFSLCNYFTTFNDFSVLTHTIKAFKSGISQFVIIIRHFMSR